MGKVPFFKMHGLGNDFVVLDFRRDAIPLGAAAAHAALADRRTGIGCDQLILLEPPRHPAAQVLMRIRNADGSEAEACGNATRCVADLLYRENGDARVRIETVAGLLEANALADGSFAVDMGPARTAWHEIPLARAMDTDRVDLTPGSAVGRPVCTNIGNPHATFFVDDVDTIDLAALGPVLEHHPLFPERANIGVAEIGDRRSISGCASGNEAPGSPRPAAAALAPRSSPPTGEGSPTAAQPSSSMAAHSTSLGARTAMSS